MPQLAPLPRTAAHARDNVWPDAGLTAIIQCLLNIGVCTTDKEVGLVGLRAASQRAHAALSKGT